MIILVFFLGVDVLVMFADRNSGRLGGLNTENGGAPDAKNLRVKVLDWCNHCNCLFIYLFICDCELLCGGLSYFIFYLILFLLREGGKQGKKGREKKENRLSGKIMAINNIKIENY